ncbi:hypothetical protein F6V30_09395 [Oryzomonas sagensis]|uniref:RadC-like JAB domain-containing protein n=1 Tax=Oryzomonas sagensis TaxID=2603857 RepID=A0ABQ6TPP3_9BACT|nr:JAB domain-containing protein [Oryzomonas sagensis]KAB0670357.1 hypothetical protein F6V30_09395 [Oryzomonas sagensis]
MALDDLNAFADQVNSQNRDKTQALLNLQNVVGTDADAYAGSLRLAGYTQVPPLWSTPEIRADAERKAVAGDPAVAAMPPVTARFFANPDNAAVAHDDIGTFTRIEDLAKNGFGPRNNAPISTLRFGTDRDRAEADYFAKEYGTKPFQALQGGLGKLATRLAFPVAGAVDALSGGDYYKEFASQLYDRFSRIQEESAADPSRSFGGKVVRSVEELVPLVLSGGFGMAAIAGQATNDTYDNLTARGVDPDTSLALAMKSGMTAYAMTKLPFGGTSLANSLVRGATLNPAFGAIDRGLEKAGLDYAGYTGQAGAINLLDPEAMAHELAMGLLFGAHHALQTGRPVGGDGLLESLVPFYDRYRAARRADALTRIGTVVRESKANNRTPELVQRHLGDVAAEHAGIDNAYVPVERWNDLFRSSGLDPARVAGETLSDPGAYDEALTTGADIAIPFREFTGKLSRLEQYGELVKDARLSPVDVSLREAEARVQAVKANTDQGGGFVEALQGMAARSREAAKGAESYRRVYDDLVGQQASIGTERGAAEHNAHLVANAFRVLGERAGVDPYELYSNYHLKVTRPLGSEFAGDISANKFWQTNYGTGEVSSFGPVWRDLTHDAQGAVERLMKYQTGEAMAALHHPDVGDIDLVWGKEGTPEKEYKDGFGFAKIKIKHPEVAGDLQNILDTMSVVSRGKNRIRLESNDHQAVVRLDWDGKEKQWLLTEFEKDKEPGTGKRTGASSIDESDSPIHQALTDFIINSKTLSMATARTYPAAKDSDSVARTLLSNARSDGGNPTIKIVHPGDDVKALFQSVAGRLASDGVRELYQSARADVDNRDHVKKVVTGVLHSAITRIKTPADAAHIAFPLTKRAQEAAIAIVTDAKGNVLGVVQHSTGALDKTIMSPRDLLGVLHDFPGAAEVWFAHNHPTGDPEPSPADSETTSQMAALLDGSGITTRGMIVVGQDGGAVWTEGIGGRTKKIPLGSLNTDKERIHEITTYDREIVTLPSSEPFIYIEQAIDYARSLGAGASGLIIADAKIRPVSFVPMSVAEMAKLKTGDPATGSSAIMSAFHKGNGASMIMVIPALPGSLGAVRNVVTFGTLFGAPLIDVIETRSGISFDKTGRMPQAGGQFFQGGNAPVSHDFVPAPDGRYVFGEITPEIGKIIRRQSAPILLRSGDAKEGKTHIERPERLKQIQQEGYDSAEKLVDDVVTNCDAIYKGERGNLLLAKKGAKNTVIYVQLNPSRYGDYYDVKTAVVARGDFFDKKKPLWERAQTNPADNGSPMRNLSGQSGLYENILHQNREDVKRGYIRFDNNRTFEIGLLKDADLSTFIHESGHFFTEVLGDLAERSDAPRQIRDDYAALLAFAGVESRNDIGTEHHEKLARAFEAYLMEGRAPSVATRSLFQRMKAWLVGVYRDLTALHAPLTPEVREVFDRMLATDAEIGRMRGTQEMKPLFAAAGDAGMTPVEFELYRKETEQAGEQAKEQMLRKLMTEKSREQTSWWRDGLARLRDEVTAEAQEQPVYRALQEILTGRDFAGDATPGLKLDRAVLARMYGEDFLKRLPKGSATDYLYAVQGGAHPELVAERYGFTSADEMIRAMMAAPPLGDFVAAEAEARMRERHGDLMRDGRMADEALKAVHNDQWAGVLRTEIGALRRKGGENAHAVAVPPVAAFRQAAQERIAAKPVRTITPLLYLNGERTAAREALDLLGTGDFNRAAAARSRQLLNHFLYFEAVTALGEVDAIRTEAAHMADSATEGARDVYQTAKRPVEDAFEYDNKKASKGTRASQSGGSLEGLQDSKGITTLNQIISPCHYDVNIQVVPRTDAILTESGRMPADARSEMRGPGTRPFREQVEALLSRFGPAGAARDESLAPRESLRQFLDRLRRDEGIDLPVPATIRDEQSRTASYRDLTMDELRSVSATLHMIEHAAAVVNTARKGETQVPLGDAEKQLVEQLEASIPAGDAGGVDDSTLSFLGQIREHAPEIDIPIVRPEALFERMDGHATSGPWHDLLWNPCNDAAHHQNRVRKSLFPAIFALIRGARIDRSKGRTFIEGLGGSLAKDEIVAIALNCGNERNLNLLMRGGIRLRPDDSARELSPETLQEILGHLNADEIAVVNGVWKAIETLKPEVGALLRRQSGAVPVFMETRPLDIANGTLEGGFYPVTLDPRHADAGEKSADAALPSRMFLRDWVGNGGAEPLSLDLENGAVRHLDRIVTRITLGEFAAQAHRLLKLKGVKAAIADRLGEPAHKNLLDWVTTTLDRDTPGRAASARLEKTSRVLRTSASASIVAHQAADTVADIVTAASGGMQRLEVAHVVRGAFEYMRNPVAVHRFAVDASEYMCHLDHEIDRTMAGALDEPAGGDSTLDDVRRWVLESRAGAAKVAAMMVWISGYRAAQAKGMDGMDAVRDADMVSRSIPNADRTGELSAAERTAKAHELATLIGPAMVRYNDAAGVGHRVADQEVRGVNRADGTTPFICGMVATGIVQDVLKNRQLEANDSFLPWFLSRMVRGLFDAIPYVDELAGHGEGVTTGKPPDHAFVEVGSATYDAAQVTLHAIGGKSSPVAATAKSAQFAGIHTGLPVLQATGTGQYLDDLLTGDYAPSYAWSPATDIINNRRYKR